MTKSWKNNHKMKHILDDFEEKKGGQQLFYSYMRETVRAHEKKIALAEKKLQFTNLYKEKLDY